ncbi:MAG: polymerase subunit delta [Verrucomicrobiaceae bacterium]|nr:polymerase subunit delta [Verrucomicrobiaceae bacterium]
MRLRADQLEKNIAQALAPIYLISGDEPLLVQECADTLRAACRKQGFSERQVFHIDNSFDWNTLLNETSAMSLFADKKLIELRMPNGKPGDAGTGALEHYCASTNADTVLMILCNKLDSSAARAKWHKAVDACGVTIPLWPIEPAQLPRWIEQRLRSKGLSATPDAIALLAERVQGNLLACVQEIEKLQLYTDATHFDVETVELTVADSARYDVFTTIDQLLLGQTANALRALAGLRGEGEEPPVILWALTKELRTVYKCTELIEQGQTIDRAIDSAGVWDKRKPLIRAALQRLSRTKTAKLLRLAQKIDAAVKGAAPDNPWILMDRLAVGISK